MRCSRFQFDYLLTFELVISLTVKLSAFSSLASFNQISFLKFSYKYKEGLASNLFPVSQLFEWSYLAAFLSIDNLKFVKITRHRHFFDIWGKNFWGHKSFLKICFCLKNNLCSQNFFPPYIKKTSMPSDFHELLVIYGKKAARYNHS